MQIIIITGPTASQKSKIALQIANKLSCSIINADSKQVYKEIPIISCQPTKDSINKLYGYTSITSNYSINNWLNDTKNAIQQTIQQNKKPLIVGGSGFYIKALIDGTPYTPTAINNLKLRQEIHNMQQSDAYNLLKKLCPENTTPINDTYRVKRDLFLAQSNKIINYKNKNFHVLPKATFKVYAILPQRQKLYQFINQRFLKIIEGGAIEEIKKIKHTVENNPWLPATKACGIPEIIKYLNKEITITEAINIAQQKTRNYAKRQYTWIQHQLKNLTIIENSSNAYDLIYKDLSI